MTGANGGADQGAWPEWQWDVALSFAGAQRDYVEQVAQALKARGVRCFCDLAASAGMSESAASHAVRWLRAHRIVSSPRRQGRMMYYRLEDAHVRMLLDLALTHTQHTQAMHPERDEA